MLRCSLFHSPKLVCLQQYHPKGYLPPQGIQIPDGQIPPQRFSPQHTYRLVCCSTGSSQKRPSIRVKSLRANNTMLIIEEIGMVSSKLLHSINLQFNVMEDLDCDSTAVRIWRLTRRDCPPWFSPIRSCVLFHRNAFFLNSSLRHIPCGTHVYQPTPGARVCDSARDCKVRSLTCDAVTLHYGKNTERKDILSHRICCSVYVRLSQDRSRQGLSYYKPCPCKIYVKEKPHKQYLSFMINDLHAQQSSYTLVLLSYDSGILF